MYRPPVATRLTIKRGKHVPAPADEPTSAAKRLSSCLSCPEASDSAPQVLLEQGFALAAHIMHLHLHHTKITLRANWGLPEPFLLSDCCAPNSFSGTYYNAAPPRYLHTHRDIVSWLPPAETGLDEGTF